MAVGEDLLSWYKTERAAQFGDQIAAVVVIA